MSKSVDQLRDISNQRMNKYTAALNKTETVPLTTNPVPEPKETISAQPIAKIEKPMLPLPLVLIMAAFLLWNIIFTVRFATMSKASNNAQARMVEIEKLSKDNLHQFGIFTSDLQQMRSRLDNFSQESRETGVRISQAEKDLDSHKFAIDNLSKAKNAIFGRVSELEARAK
jgi:septal ring factor EnvC (AmiA/AmiB activator)